MLDYDKVMDVVGDPIKEQQERGALPMELTIKDLVEDLECMLKYDYGDPSWCEEMWETEEGKKQLKKEEKLLKSFIKKYKKYA